MRQPIIAGNWKMNKTNQEAKELAESIIQGMATTSPFPEVVLCPPFTALETVKGVISGHRIIGLGAQNVFWESAGAYTGEISPNMLLTVGCRYVILGHSERRKYFSESNQIVNRKIKAAVSAGLFPILCVGETLEEREEGRTEVLVDRQLKEALKGLSRGEIENLVVAYEPIWAIGTGKTASPQQAGEVHGFIRDLLSNLYDRKLAEKLRIIYGGSVKPGNARDLFSQSQIDGGLVGGASLQADSFWQIVNSYPIGD